MKQFWHTRTRSEQRLIIVTLIAFSGFIIFNHVFKPMIEKRKELRDQRNSLRSFTTQYKQRKAADLAQAKRELTRLGTLLKQQFSGEHSLEHSVCNRVADQVISIIATANIELISRTKKVHSPTTQPRPRIQGYTAAKRTVSAADTAPHSDLSKEVTYYQCAGSFSDIYTLFTALNELPQLCAVTETAIFCDEKNPRRLRCSFTLETYYLKENS